MKLAADRRWDFPSTVILLIAIFVSAERLATTDWTPGLGIVAVLAVLGTILGLMLGYSHFDRTGIILLSLGYTQVFVPWMLGMAQYPGMTWEVQVAGLGERLGQSIWLLFQREPVEDPLLFIVFIALVFWTLSLHAGYALVRHASWLPLVLPAGIAMFIVQIYDSWAGGRVSLLAFYLFFSLLLLGRFHYLQKRTIWNQQKVWVSSSSVTDLNIGVVIATFMIVFLVWLTPTSGQAVAATKKLWEEVSQPWESLRETMSNALKSLQKGSSAAALELYGETMGLGQQSATGRAVLFTVRGPLIGGTHRYYWRVRTYDQYVSGSWHTGSVLGRSFSPQGDLLRIPDSSGWTTAEFTFTFPSRSISTLVTPGEPVWVSLPAILTFVSAGKGEQDPILFRADPPIQAGLAYRVRAVILQPTIVRLRAAGTDYPSWVTSRYLQLPENLPSRITDLARTITVDAETPYDKAQAITNYLRSEIRYSKTVSLTPPGQDTLTWFLFTTRQGFCNYYATAEVVMLRAVGVPARLAAGYAEGESQNQIQRIVRSVNAHAWPEVYFPGTGWVEFEPTTSEPPIERPSGEIVIPPSNETSQPTPLSGPDVNLEETDQSDRENTSLGTRRPQNTLQLITLIFIGLVIIIVGSTMAFTFGVGTAIRQRWQHLFQVPVPVRLVTSMESLSLVPPTWLRRWARWASLPGVERYFRATYQSLHWLGVSTKPAETPAEATATLTNHLPEAGPEIKILLEQVQQGMFSQNPGDLPAARQAAASLRRKSLRAALRFRLKSFTHLFRKNHEK